jgi:hypothetical protein
MHFDLFLVRFVTVRLTYILIDYPDCEYIIILNASINIVESGIKHHTPNPLKTTC